MRTDLTTSDWHKLIKPVLPHASTDKDTPEYNIVRIESSSQSLYAVATDGRTLGAERHRNLGTLEAGPVHVRAGEAKASLALFPFSKDDDPMLRVIIDTVPVPVTVVGEPRSVSALAVTVQRDDGTRLVMHDHRDPDHDPLRGWRRTLLRAMTRPGGRPFNGLDLRADVLARWASAARSGERLCMFSGPEPGDPLLVVVEGHFAGVWAIPQYLDAPGKRLRESPWLSELTLDVDVETGEKRGSEDE